MTEKTMCRFLLASSKEDLDSKALLNAFADMAEKSRTVEGDRQGDGWGVAYTVKSEKLNGKSEWKVYKSLKPIWEDREYFVNIPSTNIIAVHARSASFPNQIGEIDYNQPYISDSLCFVFNGVLKGVALNRSLSGKIGAQKIFSLVQEELVGQSASDALKNIDSLLRNHTREVIGLNIGLVTETGIAALCDYTEHPEYFGVHWHKNHTTAMICSEPLTGYDWTQMKKGEIYANI